MDEVLFERRGRLGLITLNRPKAMNALTHGMVLAMEARLDAWATDPAVAVVAIRGAGERAFAAGGDIRTLYEQGREDGTRNFRFFADEYRLNTKIKRYPKPYVAIMDGIVMGGGVGVSIHGSHRFVTERTTFAMPETGIGLFPDVGGTFFLPRMPRGYGMFCALTGARVRKGDAVELLDAQPLCGDDTGKLLDWLASDEPLDRLDILTTGEWQNLGLDHTEDWCADKAHLGARSDIENAFTGGSPEEILEALRMAGTEWAAEQRRTILTKSPSSTRIAFRQIREGARMEFEDCMRLEYRLARWCMTHPDFYEGVRAVIVDKDNAPRWRPPTLAEATDDLVAEAFAPLGAEELRL